MGRKGRTSRKGISLSFETIAVGTIVLVVLVVVIVFFSGAFGRVSGDIGNLNSCKAKQGNWDCYPEKKNDMQCFPMGCEAEKRWCCGNEQG